MTDPTFTTRKNAKGKMMRKLIALAFGVCFILGAGTNAAQACNNPSGVEGEQIYNSTHKVMQYCDGTDWVAMNAIDKAAQTDLDALTTTVDGKVNRAGDTMTGALNLNSAPLANAEAATKEYVDTVAASGGSNGRYQITCSNYDGTGTAASSYCVTIDTQTGTTKCQYWTQTSFSHHAGGWTDCNQHPSTP